MENDNIKRRLKDIELRCEKTQTFCASNFLTPAEVFENWERFDNAVFIGGFEESERKIAVFLPEWMSAEDIEEEELIKCLKIKSYFGKPSHRDYMGAILGLGIERDRIGDIVVEDDTAYVFCLPGVAKLISTELEKVGRICVKTSEIKPEDLPELKRETREVSFTVRSMRLDAVCSDMFSISGTAAAEMVKAGLVTLNYSVCEKCDAQIKENDVISIKGKGKGTVTETGGKSRRDRLFVTAKIYK